MSAQNPLKYKKSVQLTEKKMSAIDLIVIAL